MTKTNSTEYMKQIFFLKNGILQFLKAKQSKWKQQRFLPFPRSDLSLSLWIIFSQFEQERSILSDIVRKVRNFWIHLMILKGFAEISWKFLISTIFF